PLPAPPCSHLVLRHPVSLLVHPCPLQPLRYRFVLPTTVPSRSLRRRRRQSRFHPPFPRAIKESDDFFQNDKSQDVARESKILEGRLSEIRLGVEEEEAAVKALSSQQQEQSQIAVKTAQIEDDEGRLDERVKAEPAFTNASVISPPQDVTEASLGSVATELRMASSKLESDRVDKARQVMDLHREVANNNTNLVNTKREKSRVQLRLGELSRAVKEVEDSMRGLPDPPGEALDAAKHYDWVGGVGFSVTLVFRCFGDSLEYSLPPGRSCFFLVAFTFAATLFGTCRFGFDVGEKGISGVYLGIPCACLTRTIFGLIIPPLLCLCVCLYSFLSPPEPGVLRPGFVGVRGQWSNDYGMHDY
ncbi:unnamed protein product, partial [Ectocarpus sp. 8 AP-2014]